MESPTCYYEVKVEHLLPKVHHTMNGPLFNENMPSVKPHHYLQKRTLTKSDRHQIIGNIARYTPNPRSSDHISLVFSLVPQMLIKYYW